MVGLEQIKLFGWQAAGEINPVGIYTFDTGTLSWIPQEPITGGGGGGGPVTIADGADVAQGSTGDAPGTNTEIGKLKEIAAKLAASIAVTGPLTDTELRASPVPISAASLPLPTGAATEATLATRASEATLTTRASEATLATRASEATLATRASEATLASRLAEATFTARINTQGQKAMAASTPVVIASDQSTLPVSAASLPLPTGAATEATLATRASEATLATRLAEATFTGRFPAAGALADAMANPTVSGVGANLLGFNGATWDRLRASIAAGLRVEPTPTPLVITVTGGANAIATATLPAAGAGLFHYITNISIKRVATAALAGGAILTVTTTNLNGRAWRTGNQMSITVDTQEGTVLTDQHFAHAIRSAVANTATTIVGPAAGAAVSWHMVIDYYTGP